MLITFLVALVYASTAVNTASGMLSQDTNTVHSNTYVAPSLFTYFVSLHLWLVYDEHHCNLAPAKDWDDSVQYQ